MNREQKLALVIGFALVLVVGVLISDHLSKAQTAELDQNSILSMMPVERPADRPSERRAQSNVPPLPAGWALDVTMPEQDRGAPRRDVAVRDQVQQFAQQNPRQGSLPEPIQSPSQNAGAPILEQAPFKPVVIAVGRDQDFVPQDSSASGSRISSAHHNLLDTIRELGGEIRNGLVKLPELPVAGRASETQPRSEAATQATQPDPAAEMRVHFVQPNDSLYKIAERYYGDGNLWRVLAEHNKGRVGDDGSVRVGVRIEIPARLGSSSARASQPEQRSTQPVITPPNTRQPTPTATQRTYTVVKGDTLGEISSRLLGSSRRMNEIIAANRDQIDNADQIRVGMTLKIPAR